MTHLMLALIPLRDVLNDIPRDASAILVYIVIALFIGFMVAGSRTGGKEESESTD